MAGFKVNGVDLDTLFEPIGSTAKRADVNYLINGVDISNIYADASLGTQYGTTNFKTNNVDIGTLFAALGSITSGLLTYTWGLNNFGQLGYISLPTRSWKQVSSGENFTVALRSDDLLFTWGRNVEGQLGIGSTVSVSWPVQVGASSWVAIAAGSAHTLGITSDNRLFAWGSAGSGRLGDGTLVNKSSPVQIGASSWIAVDASVASSGAIRLDNRLFLWGFNGSGILGDSTTVNKSSPVQIGTSSWTALSLGTSHSSALRADQALFTWGLNSSGQLGDGTTINKSSPVQIGSSSWINVSAGGAHTGAITSDNRLFLWGLGNVGQNGATPGTPLLWRSLAAGEYHCLGITRDGRLWAWGRNNYGQLGDGTTIDKVSPVQIGNNVTWSRISAGKWHSVARINSVAIVWGRNNYGQLGTNDTLNRSSPVQVSVPPSGFCFDISAGWFHTLFLSNARSVYAAGRNNYGQVGGGVTTNRSTPTLASTGGVGETAVVVAGGYHSIHLRAASLIGMRLYTWGLNSSGQLGDGTTINKSSPVQVGGANWGYSKGIGAGAKHSVVCGGTGAASLGVFGHNAYGQLGDGTTINRSSPVMIYITNMNGVNAGNYHTVLRGGFNNRLQVTGRNNFGQLGLGDTINRSSLTEVAFTPAFTQYAPGNQLGFISRTIVGGFNFTAFVQTDGFGRSAGRNNFGQLGLNDTINRSTTALIGPLPANNSSPAQVGSSSWSQVALGLSHTMAITTQKSLWGLGWNASGQLGNSNLTNQYVFAQIGASSWVSVSAKSSNTSAIGGDTSPNTVFVWGQNSNGQIGNNSTVGASSPVLVGNIMHPVIQPTKLSSDKWLKVSSGSYHSLAIRSDAKLFAWGLNTSGQLGDSTTVNKSSPVQIGSSSWIAIADNLHPSASAAIRSDGGLFTWGNGAVGALASGATTNRSSPVQVGTSSWTAISMGNAGGIGLSANRLFTWGSGASGSLGDGTTVNKSSPVQIGASSWVSVAAGGLTKAAIRTDGGLFTWGYATQGNLGDGTTVAKSSPVQIGSSSWTAIAMANVLNGGHVLGLSNSRLFAWGRNANGQIGDGTTVNKSSPVQIGLSSWNAIGAGGYHSLGISINKQLFTWGLNSNRQLGEGNINTLNRSSPVQIGSSASWTAVSGGRFHSNGLNNE